jgi:DNA modification methylase
MSIHHKTALDRDSKNSFIKPSIPDVQSIPLEILIRYLTLENQVVIDPIMGSGVTGIAALKLKRKFIGIEIDPKTFEIAKANVSKFLHERKKESSQ